MDKDASERFRDGMRRAIARRRVNVMGLSQRELAVRLGVERQTVCQWESGKTLPTLANLPLLALVLDMQPHELVKLACKLGGVT